MRSASTKKQAASSLKQLLKKAIKTLRAKNRLTQEEIIKVWNDVIGAKAAAHTRPVSFRKTTLAVNMDDSGWLYELTIQKKEILKKLEGKFPGKKVKDIRFRIGEIK